MRLWKIWVIALYPWVKKKFLAHATAFFNAKEEPIAIYQQFNKFFGLANGNTGIVLTVLRAKIKGFIPGGRRITPLLSANKQQKRDKTLKVILFKEF